MNAFDRYIDARARPGRDAQIVEARSRWGRQSQEAAELLGLPGIELSKRIAKGGVFGDASDAAVTRLAIQAARALPAVAKLEALSLGVATEHIEAHVGELNAQERADDDAFVARARANPACIVVMAIATEMLDATPERRAELLEMSRNALHSVDDEDTDDRAPSEDDPVSDS